MGMSINLSPLFFIANQDRKNERRQTLIDITRNNTKKA